MNNFIYQIFAIAITAILLPKLKISSILGAVGLVLAITAVNTYLWNSSLFNFVPNTLGAKPLTLILANGVIFFVLVKILPGVELEGFFTAFIAPVLFSLITMAIQKYGHLVDWSRLLEITFNFIANLREYFLGEGKFGVDKIF